MTFVSKHPAVGIVYKKKDGTTFTQWYGPTENSWRTVNEWIADAFFFNGVYCRSVDVPSNIMCIVRAK